MSEREGGKSRGIFRGRWIKVSGAIEKTTADLGLSQEDEENIANLLVMSPPKFAGKRESRSPSPPPRTPPPSTSSAPTPPRLASFSKPSAGARQKSTTMPRPAVGKIKMEPDINNNTGVAAESKDPPDVSQLLPPKALFRRFCEFRQQRSLERWFDSHFFHLRLFAGSGDTKLHRHGPVEGRQDCRLQD